MREACPEARFYQASSLGDVRQGARGPADRDDAVLPALALRRGQGLRALHHGQLPRVLRPARDHGILFNHESPRRGLEFVTRKITWHAAAIKHGKLDKLKLGNLEARRDWGYAKDYVEAMWMMSSRTSPATTSSRPTPTTRCATASRSPSTRRASATGSSYVETDQSLVRPAEVDHLIGDYAKAERELGWRPKTSFEELIRLMTRRRPRAAGPLALQAGARPAQQVIALAVRSIEADWRATVGRPMRVLRYM